MLMLKSILVSACLFVPTLLFAHGGDLPGPHGGKIEMPGAFHVEAVRKDLQTFYVYLLDIEFTNPVIANSDVKAQVLAKSKIELACEAPKTEAFFICKSKSLLKKSVELVVVAKRDGAQGNEAHFKFSGLKAQ